MELPEERPLGGSQRANRVKRWRWLAPLAALFINLILVKHHEKNKKDKK
jgi:hypothetical protein